MNKNKIIYLVSTLKSSGPTNQLFNIIKYLNFKKIEPIIITLSPEPKNSLKYKFLDIDVKVKSLNLSRFVGIFIAKNKLKKIINQYNPDVIHTQGIRSDWLSANYFNEYKRVCTMRNYPYYDYPMTYGNILGNIMAKIHYKALNKIDHPIACSKSVSNIFRKKKQFTINYIQNGVDDEKFEKPRTEEKKQWIEKLNIPKKKNIFISVGHLTKRKDPLTIIRSFINSNIYDNSHLIFLGDGELKNKCIEFSHDYKNIEIVGRVENVNEYLYASDYFISSSLAEGLPNTVMEAMSTGLPCILSDISPHKEILNFNKNAGVIFETENINNLTNKMNSIIKRDYLSMSKSAKSIIDNFLSAKIMSNKYQKLYLK